MIRTVSALIYTDEMEVLLHRHKKLGVFMGFGGHVNDDEYEFKAMAREVYEESGISIIEEFDIIDGQRYRIKPPDDVVQIWIGNENRYIIDHTYFIKVDAKIRQQKIVSESDDIECGWYDMKMALNELEMFDDTRQQITKLYQDLYLERNMVLS